MSMTAEQALTFDLNRARRFVAGWPLKRERDYAVACYAARFGVRPWPPVPPNMSVKRAQQISEQMRGV